MNTRNSATWTDEDFRVLFGFLADVRAVLASPEILDADTRAVLVNECQEASRRLAEFSELLQRHRRFLTPFPRMQPWPT